MAIRVQAAIVASLVLILGSDLRPGHAQETKPSPFSPGETLTYEVTWSVFTAGDATATLKRVGEGPADPFEVETVAHSRGFVSLLYKVDNEFHSFFDPQTLCSRHISKRINEGRRHKETQIVFDAARRLAILDERDLANPRATPKHAENEIPGCVEDVVSAFYFLRSQPLQIGQRLMVPINDGAKTRQVAVDVQARERIETPLGSRVAFRVEPSVYGNLYRRKGRMLIWFSDDAERLPVRVKAILSVGAITATLKSVSRQAPPAPAAKS